MSNATLRLVIIGVTLINAWSSYYEDDVSEAIAWILVSLVTTMYHSKMED